MAQLEAQRARQAEQLKMEARARQELEDMLLRIERHFKVGQGCFSRGSLRQIVAILMPLHGPWWWMCLIWWRSVCWQRQLAPPGLVARPCVSGKLYCTASRHSGWA